MAERLGISFASVARIWRNRGKSESMRSVASGQHRASLCAPGSRNDPEGRSSQRQIAHAVVTGEGRRYRVALVVLDANGAEGVARLAGVERWSFSQLACDPVIIRHVRFAVEQANRHVSDDWQIKRFTILPVAWIAAGDELTSSG
jgi:hypothetical protein